MTKPYKKKYPTAGQPRKYKSSNELLVAIKLFFEECARDKVLPDKAGLRVFLDISKDTYNEYRKKYPVAIRLADETIESAWVKRLGGSSATGAIFYLKNAFKDDYRDTYAHTGEDGGPIKIDVTAQLNKVYGG